MSKKRLILSTSLRKRIRREKLRPIGLEGASGRALDP